MASQRVPSGPESPSGPVIDDAVFERLLADLGADHVRRVCRIFLANADEGIVAVGAAVAAGDAALVADGTHRLKSSSGFLGARRLVALCADIEVRARADALDGTGGVQDVLAGELQLASAELARRVGVDVASDDPGG